mmetsp:Transcript_18171/g.42055  ORF Transcript_18171/g.42055 Transcript_18171/m.42055 type:complete len:140 (+) Transcript_18171:312-731(+)
MECVCHNTLLIRSSSFLLSPELEEAFLVLAVMGENGSGSSLRYYMEDPSAMRLILILLGYNDEDFPGLALVSHWMGRPPDDALRNEVERRIGFLPPNDYVVQSHQWLLQNPIHLEQFEIQYFQMKVEHLAGESPRRLAR